jgi:2-(3-amino-3-carboxypropyl)histidine synthase
LGVSLATGKPTFVFDPILKEIREISEFKDRIIRQRFAQISKAKNASVFGILIGEKKGQSRKALALKIKKKLEEHGKKAYLISIREIVPEHFLGLKIDAFVNTACPRIPIDDALKYKQAFLTPKELEIVLGERKWEEYQMDEL